MRSLLPFKIARGYALGSEHCIRASTGDSLRSGTVAFACQKDRGAVSRSIVQASGLLIPNLANSRNPEIQTLQPICASNPTLQLATQLDGYLFWHRSRSEDGWVGLGQRRSGSQPASTCVPYQHRLAIQSSVASVDDHTPTLIISSSSSTRFDGLFSQRSR